MSTDSTTGEDVQDETTEGPGAPSSEGVAEGIMQMFADAIAAGTEPGPTAAATPAESARLLDDALTRWEREMGLNVLPFPEWASRREEKPEG